MNQQPRGALQAGAGLSRTLMFVMALACGAAVANIYYNQPLLGVMEHDFPGQEGLVGFVPTATQLGYAAGIFLLVPLGDRVERRRLILVQSAVLCLALLVVAIAPTPALMVAGSILVGIFATMAQQIVPFAAELAEPDKRGVVIGTVMSGLLCGILSGRTLAGFIGHWFGWRMMFVVAIGIMLAVTGLLAAVLPRGAPKTKDSYWTLLGSLWGLLRTEADLGRATAIQTLLFASFSVFWTILALRLEQPPYHMGADVAGLFGLVGAIGVLIAPVAGRMADRRGPHVAIGLGIVVMVLSWAVFGLWGSIAGLIVGVLLLDIGEQGALVSNQHIVYSLRPDARNRLNTILVGGMFLGGAAGSAGSTICWHQGGWPAVCWFGVALVVAALGLHLHGLGQRRMSAKES
ncbi:MFS transporter [Lichenihabitans psoromatis]|uniref:MFS transporter n=1 Tax=Lichenihabitans psoromatis TaxID=2528642 RepID=UPI001A9454BA|nr:MFS transporter [Lichenihabitans psoromatis]